MANEAASAVTRLDPATSELQEITVGNGPEAVAIASGSVWVANGLDGTVSRIDPARNAIAATIPVGRGPSSLLAQGGAIWVADSYGDRIARIDPARNEVVRGISVGSAPQDLAAIGGRIWLSVRETATGHHGGTLRLFGLQRPDTLDPAIDYNSAGAVTPSMSDGLVGYKRVGGLDGNTLVPDLATSLPRPTDRGRTYTFQLRRGLRYSTGDPVRASDVRRALERAFRLGSPVAGYYHGIVGGDACSKARCDLTRGVVTDDLRGTLTLHLRRPDPEMFYKLALPAAFPVPRRVSLTKGSPLGVPGTGPYMVKSFARHAPLVLERNPRYREWSAAAQPAGYPDRIVVTYNGRLDDQLTAVEQGKSDFMQSPLPPERVHEITTRYAALVHVFPASATFGVVLNTRCRPLTACGRDRRSATRSTGARPYPGSAASTGRRSPAR